MNIHIITIFPDIFASYFNESIIKRAWEKSAINIKIHNLRDWAEGKHKTVDDTPYGGGAGMVLKANVIYKALQAITKQRPAILEKKRKIILLSAKGKTWNQQLAKKYAKLDSIVLICGRYEGVDERVTKFVDEEISIGDYVLTGGEIGAMAIVDSITRLLPGVLGNSESVINESHSIPGQLEYPQYTRPEIFIAAPLIRGDGGVKKYKVPEVLLGGNHKEIEKWRRDKSKSRKLTKN
jgi:tRNA (guanine37-N1)-methyltransferase